MEYDTQCEYVWQNCGLNAWIVIGSLWSEVGAFIIFCSLTNALAK